jgi:hypothetical protein
MNTSHKPENETHKAFSAPGESVDFIRAIIQEDLKTGQYQGRVHTRFPRNPTATSTSAMPNPFA